MSDTDVKPSTDHYSTIRKLSSPNDESNWDTWSFAMRMMLRGRNLEYVIEGGFKEGYNGSSTVLPDVTMKSDNRLVSSIIASRVHEENFATIAPCQYSARRMWRALSAAHQNNTAGGRYMYLRSMMTLRADGDDDVSRLITTMDTTRQRLLNVCPEGTVSVDDIYVSSLISALPNSWTSVTAPLELQSVVTPAELKKVLRGHFIKIKNRETTTQSSASAALSATSLAKKPKAAYPPRPECDYCNRRGHSSKVCHQKQMDDQRKEIDALKQLLKSSKLTKSAKVAHLSESDSDSSVTDVKSSRAASSSQAVRFSRKASSNHNSDHSSQLVYNADTGCTDTLVTSSASLQSSRTIPAIPIYMADDTTIDATAVGPIKTPISLTPIPGLVVPGLAENLLSIGQLADHGVTSVFGKDKVKFYQTPVAIDGKKIGEGLRVNQKYLVRPLSASPTSTSPASLLKWHMRLSHLGEASIRRLEKQGIIQVTDWDRKGIECCQACKNGRLVRRRFGSREKYRVSRPLEIVHSDVCQLSSPSHKGFRYFVSFIDDYSKHAVVYHIRMKSQVFECFIHFINSSERETGLKLVDLRSDNGGEYFSNRMKEYCRSHGIKQTMGPPHTPQLNGLAERYNQTLLDRLKPSLMNSTLNREYWSDALSYAVWTTNRSPTRTKAGQKTPFKVYTGRLPSMRHAHVFGARGVYLALSVDRKKLDSHSRDCIFLGVLPHGDGVKVLDTITRKVVKTREAYFDEGGTQQSHPSNESKSNLEESDDYSPWSYPDSNHDHPVPDGSDLNNNLNNHQPAPDGHNQRPQRHRIPPDRLGNLRAYSASLDKSPTYKSATTSVDKDKWTAAMKLEINNFVKRDFFTLVPRPRNQKIISCRWHLKKKYNLDGSINKFKVILVARGFTQREGIDYNETFAPSSRQESLKAFLAVNGHRDWDVIQLDVVGAFLYGDLDEIIYLGQPEGFVNPEYPDHVWKLNSSLYGLK